MHVCVCMCVCMRVCVCVCMLCVCVCVHVCLCVSVCAHVCLCVRAREGAVCRGSGWPATTHMLCTLTAHAQTNAEQSHRLNMHPAA